MKGSITRDQVFCDFDRPKRATKFCEFLSDNQGRRASVLYHLDLGRPVRFVVELRFSAVTAAEEKFVEEEVNLYPDLRNVVARVLGAAPRIAKIQSRPPSELAWACIAYGMFRSSFWRHGMEGTPLDWAAWIPAIVCNGVGAGILPRWRALLVFDGIKLGKYDMQTPQSWRHPIVHPRIGTLTAEVRSRNDLYAFPLSSPVPEERYQLYRGVLSPPTLPLLLPQCGSSIPRREDTPTAELSAEHRPPPSSKKKAEPEKEPVHTLLERLISHETPDWFDPDQQRKAVEYFKHWMVDGDEDYHVTFLRHMDRYVADAPVKGLVATKSFHSLSSTVTFDVTEKSKLAGKYSHMKALWVEEDPDTGRKRRIEKNAMREYLEDIDHTQYENIVNVPGKPTVMPIEIQISETKTLRPGLNFNAGVPPSFLMYRRQYLKDDASPKLPESYPRLDLPSPRDLDVSLGVEEITKRLYVLTGFHDKYGRVDMTMSPRDAWANLVDIHDLDPLTDGNNKERHARLVESEGAEAMLRIILFHIFVVFTNRTPLLFWYVCSWFARILKEPWKKAKINLAVLGTQGVGKSSLIANIGKHLFGSGTLYSYFGGDVERLAARFNSQFDNAVYLLLDESEMGEDKRTSGIIKALTTEDLKQSEKKGQEAKLTQNFVNLILVSNSITKGVRIEPGDRRSLIMECVEFMMAVKDYTNILQPRIDTRFAMLVLGHWLYYTPLLHQTSFINFDKPPPFTAAKRQNVMTRDTPTARQWHSTVERGVAPEQCRSVRSRWEQTRYKLQAETPLWPVNADLPKYVPWDGAADWLTDADLPTLFEAYKREMKVSKENESYHEYLKELHKCVVWKETETAGHAYFPCVRACRAMYESHLEYGNVDDQLDCKGGRSWVQILFEQARLEGRPELFHAHCLFCLRASRAWTQFAQLPVERKAAIMGIDATYLGEWQRFQLSRRKARDAEFPFKENTSFLVELGKHWLDGGGDNADGDSKFAEFFFEGVPEERRGRHILRHLARWFDFCFFDQDVQAFNEHVDELQQAYEKGKSPASPASPVRPPSPRVGDADEARDGCESFHGATWLGREGDADGCGSPQRA
jgi:hypothetical protein